MATDANNNDFPNKKAGRVRYDLTLYTVFLSTVLDDSFVPEDTDTFE
jgi:hypothetical protein